MHDKACFSGSVPRTWQSLLSDAVRDVGELGRLLDLPVDALTGADDATTAFPLLVPRGFIARMRRGDPEDPLLRQVLPRPAEADDAAGFTDDPLDERQLVQRGVIRKYPGRALLVTTGACPVHCRYCFRRAFPYSGNQASGSDWQAALGDLRQPPDVSELILSGGDPLSLSDRKLESLFMQIETGTGIGSVRIHTRFPIMIPERVTRRLTSLISDTSLNVVVVLHANHAREIDTSVRAALSALADCATALLNQSVLLHGINDDATTLVELSERLFECGTLPYYLHQLDRVTGTRHFAVEDSKALELMDEIRSRLPGYLVPRLVREVPGRLSKTPVGMGPAML